MRPERAALILNNCPKLANALQEIESRLYKGVSQNSRDLLRGPYNKDYSILVYLLKGDCMSNSLNFSKMVIQGIIHGSIAGFIKRHTISLDPKPLNRKP